jgi:uncharacterized protein with ATP-grasp and redox domains
MQKPPNNPIHIWPECPECIMGMVKDVIAMTSGEAGSYGESIHSLTERILDESLENQCSAPATANRIIREFKRLSGISDPYFQFKKRELKQAREIYARMEGVMGEDLRSCASLAVLGNSLDFFIDPEKSLSSLPEVIEAGINFYYDDISRLEQFLSSNPGLVLYFSDNAGEIFFDIPFFRFIRERSKQAILVVKGGPSANDLTRAEIKSEHLESEFKDIADTGTDGMGIDWDHVSTDFKDLFRSADLIISKGMANFETLYTIDRKRPCTDIFFLLKAKCGPVSSYLKAPPGSYCAIWQEGNRSL